MSEDPVMHRSKVVDIYREPLRQHVLPLFDIPFILGNKSDDLRWYRLISHIGYKNSDDAPTSVLP
jgi:hypothetical protein